MGDSFKDNRASPIWLPQEEIRARYDDLIEVVEFSQRYIGCCPFPYEHAFWAIGGTVDISPDDLERQVLDLYHKEYDKMINLALRFDKAEKEPLILKDEDDRDIGFDVMISFIHTYGIGYSDETDIERLRTIKQLIPALRENIRYARMIGTQTNFARELGSELKPYSGMTVGNIKEADFSRGRIDFRREFM